MPARSRNLVLVASLALVPAVTAPVPAQAGPGFLEKAFKAVVVKPVSEIGKVISNTQASSSSPSVAAPRPGMGPCTPSFGRACNQ